MTFNSASHHQVDIGRANATLSALPARKIVEWATTSFEDGLALSTSFGIQSAVMLHLATQVRPDIPVIWIDTGYLPKETYHFAEKLTERLNLNLHVYQSHMSPPQMERLHGKLWESDDVDDLNLYDKIRKVEPMQRALKELGVSAWLSGLRREQTEFRKKLSHLTFDGARYKVLPILDWTAKDVYEYLRVNDLPYHPLFDQGYVTVGDWHSSRPLSAEDDNERATRFRGLKQECGIHTAHNIALAAA